jgi:ribonucleoside-diphosphate reductase subunit M2
MAEDTKAHTEQDRTASAVVIIEREAVCFRPERVLEPLQDPRNLKATIPPIQYIEVYNMYKKLQACTWTAEEVPYHDDLATWKTMSENEKYFVKRILAFFACSDSVVMDNIDQCLRDLQIRECRLFYALQGANEAVHSETYGLLLSNLVPDEKEREMLFNAVATIPTVAAKVKWAQKWTCSGAPLGYIVVAFVAVEGIFFSGSFAAIYWLKKQGKLPGLGFANELISRDEGLHTEYGWLMYHMLKNKISQEEVHAIFKEACDISKQFMVEALPCAMIGMNAQQMCQYIEFITDYQLRGLGFDPLYNVQQPFDFINLMGIVGKTDFFARAPTDYRAAFVTLGVSQGDNLLDKVTAESQVCFDADF